MKGVLQSPKIVKKLISLGKDIHLQLFVTTYVPISLLHYAAKHGHPETIKLLIDAGADIHAKTIHGSTPLHYAADSHNPGAVKALIMQGADYNATDNKNQTPLHVAVITGDVQSTVNIPCAKILLLAGANPDLKDIHGKTALESLYTGRHHLPDRIERWHNVFKQTCYH